MIINFDKIEEKSIEGFKGGEGTFLTRMADDGNVKIMRNVLKPGSSIGTHTHTDNCEGIRRRARPKCALSPFFPLPQAHEARYSP